jgi:uncharacterized C2H2 Zn-finger protein
MKRFLCAALAAFALAGCQSAPKTAQNATETPAATPAGTEAAVAGAPKEIMVLTDQTKVWECPKCGMDFDGPGVCTMDGATLLETQVSYICPADSKPVEHAGKCPRCPMNARVDKVAVAANAGGQ